MPRPLPIVLAVLALSSTVFAQEMKPGTIPNLALGQGPDAKPKTPGDYPAYADVTKDMDAEEGLMTFLRYKPADATKDPTRLLCVVPKNLLKQDLLFAVNFSRGNMAGFQYTDGLVRWEQYGRSLALVAPDTRFIDRPGNPINDAVQRTYRPSFIASLPIVTLTPAGDPVVDFGAAVFAGRSLVPLPMRGIIRREISRVDAVKAFPENTLIDVDLGIDQGGGGSTIGVSYAFRRLPALGGMASYRPRVADERVGYFQTTRQDWTTKYSERESLERFVNRWDLKKKDPSLDLSPPEKPIVFVIDKSVPLQWRSYVAAGVSEWNKAFEKVGLSGAIVVQQQTADNEFADIDPADARYNFILWTVRNQVLAVGPSRADPRTGQILDADIVIDDSWIRYFNESSETFTPKAMAAMLGPGMLDFLKKNPAYLPPGMTQQSVEQADREFAGELLQTEELKQSPLPMRPAAMQQQCQLAVGLVHQLAIGQLVGQQAMAAAAKAAPGAMGLPKIPDSIIGNALKLVVMHEVGHTLGLRHNFKASSWLTLDDVRKHRDAGEAFVASVMDYTPLAFFADDDIANVDKGRVKTFSSDQLGPYDFWAVNYGYGTPAEGTTVKQYLKGITDQSTKRENAYGTDEDTMGLVSPDPLTNRYDLGDNPAAWARSQIALTDKLLANVTDWAQKPDEPNHYLRDTFVQLMFERSRNLMYVGRTVGGQYFSRSRPGDPGAKPPLTLVDPKLQRESLELIGKTVLSADFYKAIKPEILNRLTPTRMWDFDDFPNPRVDFPYSRFVESQYGLTLMVLCSPETLQRVYDAESKTDAADKFSAAELIRGTRDSVWSELKSPKFDGVSDAKPLIPPLRRGMQDTHLKYLIATADVDNPSVSPDLKNLARFALRELSEQIAAALKAGSDKVDFASRGHLVEAKSKIDRTLDKPLVDVASGGGVRIIVIGQDGKPVAAANSGDSLNP